MERAGQNTADFTVVETGEQVAVTGNGLTWEGLCHGYEVGRRTSASDYVQAK